MRFKGSTERHCRIGRSAFREYREAIRGILADYRCDILDVSHGDCRMYVPDPMLEGFGLGDVAGPHCVARVKFSGKHVAPFHTSKLLASFAPTGTKLSWIGIAYFFFTSDGKYIQSLWVMGDVASLHEQLAAGI